MDLLYRLLFHRWIVSGWLQKCTNLPFIINNHPLTLLKFAEKYYYPILAILLLVVLGSSLSQVLFGECFQESLPSLLLKTGL